MDVKIFDVPILECVTCMDMVKAIDTVQLECEPDRHIYCHTCLVELFVKATKDESIYPPSCCGKDIPLETVQPFLEPAQTEDFLNKSVEFRTTKRTYCHDRLCSTFIPQPEIEDNIGTCLECDSDTCAVCKHAAHEGEDCRKDDTDRDLLYMSQREGWKRCPRCERVIGLRVGCFHITCLCKKEFCYLCSAPWRTCSCPPFEEQLLMDEADRGPVQEGARRRRGFVNLPGQCTHVRTQEWRKKHSHEFYWECAFCSNVLPWLLMCPLCGVRICLKCKSSQVV